MTKDLENLINLIFMSSASSLLLSGNSISQPEKIAFHVAKSYLCKDKMKQKIKKHLNTQIYLIKTPPIETK